MNFQTILEELDRLYEELPAKEVAKKEIEEVEESEVVEACDKKSLTEEADDEEIEIVDDETEEVADEAPEEEPEEEVEEPAAEEEEARQLILECDNCGALVIRAEADVKVDEETDLANVGDVCEFCEESVGSKIVGVVAPYEVALEEGIFGKKKSKEPEIERVPYLGMKHTSGAFAKEICQKVQKEIGGKVVRAGANECFWLADNAKQFDLGNKLMHDLVRSSRMPNTSIVTEAFDEHEGEELEELLDFDVDLPISVNADGNSVAVGGVA